MDRPRSHLAQHGAVRAPRRKDRILRGPPAQAGLEMLDRQVGPPSFFKQQTGRRQMIFGRQGGENVRGELILGDRGILIADAGKSRSPPAHAGVEELAVECQGGAIDLAGGLEGLGSRAVASASSSKGSPRRDSVRPVA